MRVVLGCAAGLVLACGVVAGQAKLDGKLLLGRWEPVAEKEGKDPKDPKDKKEKAPAGPAMVVEFATDPKADPKGPTAGKMSMTVTDAGKDYRADGTFSLEGDKLAVYLKLGDREVKETLTVKKLTADELVTEDAKNKVETLRRKK